jgi:glyoxylase-like metal-dependent hydrolase (beta-lactamase superfamily II)
MLAIGADYSAIPATSLTPFRTIRRIEIPLPLAPGHVNVYLVPCKGGWILVDTGMNTPGTLERLEGAGVELASIQRIVLTHVHPDHSGLAAVLRERTGAEVWMHSEEDRVLESLQHPERWLERQRGLLTEVGVPSEMLGPCSPATTCSSPQRRTWTGTGPTRWALSPTRSTAWPGSASSG